MKFTFAGLRNFVSALRRLVNRAVVEDPRVDKSTKEKRLSICQDCRYREGIQCSRCECLIRLKTMLKTETCPEGKW
jgi:hypothetical protein